MLFFAALAGIASGSKGPTTVTFAIGVVIGWAWISALAARLLSEHPAAKGEDDEKRLRLNQLDTAIKV